MKLILITLVAVVVGMMVACESASRTSMLIPTPSGPMYSEEEVIAVLKEHLQAKPLPIPRVKGIRGGKAASNPKIIPNQTRISTDIVQRGLRGRRNRNARNLGF